MSHAPPSKSPSDNPAAIPPNDNSALATLVQVDNKNRAIGLPMLCPFEEIDTYKKLEKTLKVLFSDQVHTVQGRNGSVGKELYDFRIMTPERAVIHEKYWERIAAKNTSKIFHIEFNYY